ncbi:transposase [Clostridium sp. UBA6640]|uniref:transposase n=1 Tax=Clostridium sp. UBA6640 TaxID=1946370 RepID=UPI0025C06816|nr:transposase [Clostridium sp. UBA6640]
MKAKTIAVKEILVEKYDGEKITFWYEDYDDGHKIRVTMNVLESIGKITQHIFPKGFKTVKSMMKNRIVIGRECQ